MHSTAVLPLALDAEFVIGSVLQSAELIEVVRLLVVIVGPRASDAAEARLVLLHLEVCDWQ